MSESGGKGGRKRAVGDAAGFDFSVAPVNASAKPHYHDHRERLRGRFDAAGPSALADYELLELLLFRSIPRRDVKPLAKRLIERFGDFAAVLGAEPDRIAEVDGAGPSVARDLKLIQAAIERAGEVSARKRPSLTAWTQLNDYVRVRLQHETREQFRVLFLDRKNQLIADEAQTKGTVDAGLSARSGAPCAGARRFGPDPGAQSSKRRSLAIGGGSCHHQGADRRGQSAGYRDS